MARCCWSRYPAYLISVSTDLSSFLISDDESLSKKRGIRSRRTAASCSIVISGRLSNCANGCPNAEERSTEAGRCAGWSCGGCSCGEGRPREPVSLDLSSALGPPLAQLLKRPEIT